MPPLKKEKKALKNQLIDELTELRQRAAELEASKEAVKKTEDTLGDSREIDLEKLMGLKQMALEVHYRALFENNPVETIIVDTEARVTGTNLTDTLGGEQGPNIGDIMYKDYASNYEINMYQELMDCIKTNIPKEFPKQRYNGNFLHIWMSPFAGGAIITSIDITDKVLLEESLRKSQKRSRFLAQILDNVVQPLVVAYPDGRIMTYNEAFCNLVGYSKEEMHKITWLTDLMPSKWHESLTNVAENLVDSGEPQALQMEFTLKNGSTAAISVMAYPFIDNQVTPQPYYLFLTPLEDSVPKGTDEKRYQMICENAPFMIYGFDLQGNCVLWNNECEKNLGWKRNEISSHKSLLSLMFPESKELEKAQTNLKKPNKTFHDYIIHAKNGFKRQQSWAHFIIADGTMVSVGYDITRWKTIEEQLFQTATQLKDLDVEITRYNHAMEHDLRAHLFAVKNYTNFLKDDLKTVLSHDHQSYLDGLIQAARETEEMVEGLITLAQINRQESRIEEIHMGKFFQELIASINVPSDVHIAMGNDWPTIKSDPSLVRTIFLNLIDNAIKFNTATHKLIQVGWKSLDTKRYEFFVRDNGIGIKQRYMEQIFGIFERLHTLKEFRGTGVGLAVVRKAVYAIRGSIRLESTPGGGTTFFITLPRTDTEP
ncbi:MAG: PAS domain S-box protein [Deltaproteobacteria bacterium]|nr:PAS domain S-box protein [Deltaproteobacteria bacterium]